MATLFSIADEVAVSLGMTHDDARENRGTLAYYVKIAVDKLNDRRLTKDYSGDQRSSASNIETFVVDVVHQVAPFVPSGDAGAPEECLFFEMPANLLNLPFDGGLVWVRYHRPTLPLNCRHPSREPTSASPLLARSLLCTDRHTSDPTRRVRSWRATGIAPMSTGAAH